MSASACGLVTTPAGTAIALEVSAVNDKAAAKARRVMSKAGSCK
jgi:hypothetical protein